MDFIPQTSMSLLFFIKLFQTHTLLLHLLLLERTKPHFPPTMAPQLPLLLLLLFPLISISIPSTTAHPPTSLPTDFIKSSCKATLYPALCYRTLSPFATKIRHSSRQLALTALAVSLSRARSAAQFVSGLAKPNHRDIGAVKDCIDTVGDSVDQLSRSIRELGRTGSKANIGREFKWRMSNVQTWVSAALTDESTCVDGLSQHAMNKEIKGAIQKKVTHVAHVTSIALALVNRCA